MSNGGCKASSCSDEHHNGETTQRGELTQFGAQATTRGSVMLREMRGTAGKTPAWGTRYGAMPQPKRRVGMIFIMLVAIVAAVATPRAAQAQNARSWKNEGD